MKAVRFSRSAPGILAMGAFALSAQLSSAATVWLPGFVEDTVASRLISPAGLDFTPDGRVFIGQQKGQVIVIQNDSALPQPLINLQPKLDYNTERGLNGLLVDPDFATNGYLYIYYTAKFPIPHNRLSRFTVTGNVADTTETVIFQLDTLPSRNTFTSINVPGNTNKSVWHMGGGIALGNDGKFYIGVGEHEVPALSQNMNSLFGKILRINRDGSIPADNPFYNSATGQNRAIYALGLRNPFTLAVQRSTGRLFANDVGEGTWEEVDTIVAGKNYGWNSCEGFYNSGSTTTMCSNANYTRPLFAYRHGNSTSTGNSVVGGGFTNSFRASDTGKYFFGDFTNNNGNGLSWIKRVNPLTGGDTATLATGISNLVALKFGPNGSMYYISRGYSTGTIDTGGSTVRGWGRAVKVTYPASASSVLQLAKERNAALGGWILSLGSHLSMRVPLGAAEFQIFDLNGRMLWRASDLRSGERLELPASLPQGMLKYRWTSAAP